MDMFILANGCDFEATRRVKVEFTVGRFDLNMHENVAVSRLHSTEYFLSPSFVFVESTPVAVFVESTFHTIWFNAEIANRSLFAICDVNRVRSMSIFFLNSLSS